MKVISIFILFLLSFKGFSQKQQIIKDACSYYGEKTPTSAYVFTSDNEAVTALKLITDASGLASNFQILASDVPNAAAVIINNERFVLYNQTFMYNISQRVNYWASISILAHEIGHHLNGHSLIPGGSRPSIELEADKFSGFILAKLGASLQEAQSAINALVTEAGSTTHPGRTARLAAIANGWYQNNSLSKGPGKQADTNISLRPRSLFYGDEKYREQVFIKKYNTNSFELISEKGYIFSKTDFKIIDINEDLKIFWFPDWTSYGYIDEFRSIETNRLVQCKVGDAPVSFYSPSSGLVTKSSNYLSVIFPDKSFYIYSNGAAVKGTYLGTNDQEPIPDKFKYYIYQIYNGIKFVNISIYFRDIEDAVLNKRVVVAAASELR